MYKKFNLILYIQGVLDHPYTPFLSKTKHFREKRFQQKLYGFEGNIRWCHWFDLGWHR